MDDGQLWELGVYAIEGVLVDLEGALVPMHGRAIDMVRRLRIRENQVRPFFETVPILIVDQESCIRVLALSQARSQVVLDEVVLGFRREMHALPVSAVAVRLIDWRQPPDVDPCALVGIEVFEEIVGIR